MTRIAIIDHDNHNLIVEDISDEDLQKYGGSEQDYIDDNFTLGNYSWDYIVGMDYYTEDDKDGISIDFEKIK